MTVKSATAVEYPSVAACVPAPRGRRVVARLVDALIGVVGYALVITLFVVGSASAGLLLLAVLALGPAVVVLVRAATPGGLLLGLTNVNVRTGQRSGGRTFGKYLLEGIVCTPTAGLGAILLFTTIDRPLGRHLFDRWAGVMVVDTRRGSAQDTSSRATRTSPAPEAARSPLIVPIVATPAGPYIEEPTVIPAVSPAATPLIEASGIITSVPGRPPLSRPVAPPAATPDLGPVAPAAVESRPDDPEDHTYVDEEWAVGSPELVLEDGRRISVAGLVLVGRDPVGRGESEDATLVVVQDADMSISKTHLAVSPNAGSVVLRDLGSTNGTRFRLPGGEWQVADAGQRYELSSGSIVRFGRRSFEVAYSGTASPEVGW